MKKLVLVTSPPACGKTFISKKLAKALTNCVYLDKDTLIVLSKQIFKVAGEEYNRSSDFFLSRLNIFRFLADEHTFCHRQRSLYPLWVVVGDVCGLSCQL